jgi:hypothetical protein
MKKRPRGDKSPNIITDVPVISLTKQSDFLRCCMNCIKRKDCPKIPPKISLKRWKEYCDTFLPDYRKIDRERTNHAQNTIINPDSPSGKMIALRGAGELLGKVESVLNELGGGGSEVLKQ